MPIKLSPAGPPRASVSLTGTHSKAQASLDSSSALAVAYAQAWCSRHGSAKVPASGVVRRALAVYVRHLQAAGASAEVPAVVRACKVLPAPQEAYEAALRRLAAVPAAAALPPFDVIRDGPAAVAERQALHARLDAIAAGDPPPLTTHGAHPL